MVADNERAMIVSSDGHAMPHMRDYRPYLAPHLRDRFDDFCTFYDTFGTPSADPSHLRNRLDPEILQQWIDDVFEPGRIEGTYDSTRRLQEMEREGVVAEVLFPDFGLPFEAFGQPSRQARQGTAEATESWPERTPEEILEGAKAHNRWLVDYCSVAPERFCAMAVIPFHDLDAAQVEIKWAKEHGFGGVLLPTFSAELPIFHEQYDVVWSLLEDLDMPLNSHVAISSSQPRSQYQGVPDPRVAMALSSREMIFRCHELLIHMIYSGAFERHPRLRMAFTEQGSAWVGSLLRSLDYSWEGSYQRRVVHEVIKHKPSEYFRRQCFLGSSIFSRAEVEARHEIGLEAMCLGMDYPHHEGTFASGGTTEYLRATVGAAHVPADEARMLLADNAIRHWGFDAAPLRALADRVGPSLEFLLTPPEADLFPRGDVHKPLVAS